MFFRFIVLILFMFTGISGTGFAATAQAESEGEKDEKEQTSVHLEDDIVETNHSVTVDGTTIPYTARTGTVVFRDEEGKPKATVFFVYYSRDEVGDPRTRPVTFAFNGGPGSSSVWLHLGAFGPKRVWMSDEGFEPPPPYRLEENPFTLLDISDLVFIDPVTTGFSRAAPGEDPKQFHGVEEDVQAVGDVIRLLTTRYRRWASPKFLTGESYGTTRAAGLSGYLQQRHGIYLNGIILISSVLDFQTLLFHPGNDLPYLLFLPSYTATAWYHNQLPADLQPELGKALAEAERFALSDYALALLQGSRLSEQEAQQIAEQLSRLTGLSTDFILKSDLRVPAQRFFKELLRHQSKTAGRLDSRFTGNDRDSAGERPEYDPSMAAITGPFTAMLNDYVRSELNFESDLPYEILTGRVRPWSYGSAENRYLNVAETLRQAMTQNPSLRVFVGSGYYDLATPYFATDYTLDHLGLEAGLRQNISTEYYEAGHMMYIRLESLRKLKEDLARFFDRADNLP